MSSTDARKSQLLSLKLRAIVREHLGLSSDADLTPDVFARGAAVVHDSAAWVLVEEGTDRGLGPALLWAIKAGHARLHVLASSSTGMMARRAAYFDFEISVWHVSERSLLPAVAEPFPDPVAPLPEHVEFVELIRAGGATPNIEHGVVTGEVTGLEVCRAVTDPHTGEVRLEVGMGAHDREAFALLHGGRPTLEALSDVVSSVREHRRPGALAHPFNRIAPERGLRARVIAEPGLVGAVSLEVCDPPVPRTNVLDTVPCVARGLDDAGRPLVVVFTSGADPDIVPFALDARAFVDFVHATKSDLVIAMPDSHMTPTNRAAMALATVPVRFSPVTPS